MSAYTHPVPRAVPRAVRHFAWFALVCVVALVRYRAMVPSLLALLVLDYLIRRVVLRFIPIVRTGTPPGVFINIALLAMMIAALALSLRRARTAAG